MNSIEKAIEYLKYYKGEPKVFMEVCGTHTAAIAENGIPDIISDKIKLISGPGCPVCVTVAEYIDRLLELSLQENVCVVTFGDMLRVPGNSKSLRDVAAEGGRVQMVYSPFEVIELAKNEPNVDFVFAAVGFETTTPIYALIIETLEKEHINNIKLLTALKTMPEAIKSVARDNDKISGFIAPGHVAVITGHKTFSNLSKELNMPFVTAGFKGEELIAALAALTRLSGGKALNMYPSVVTNEGNEEAQKLVLEYFEPYDAAWRGLGVIENSGMVLKDKYKKYDAGSKNLTRDNMKNKACSCGAVISGKILPSECPLYGRMCTPQSPQGACMVSFEGSCYQYYINGRQ